MEKDGKAPMHMICRMIASVAFIFPGIALAQTPAGTTSTTDERRLTQEQIEAILAESAAKRAASQTHMPVDLAAGEEEDLPPPARQVHGEVGFGIGTHGYREAYGTAIYPLGDDGFAAISFDFVDWGRRRWPR